MRTRNPVDPAVLRDETDAAALERAMALAIGRGETPPDPVPAGDAFAAGLELSPRRPFLRPAPLVAALVLLIAAVLALSGAFSGGGSHPTYAAAAVKVAEANPRLLITAPGWKVTDAGEFEADNGEMTFGDGSRTLELTWYPALLYRSYLRDRAKVSPPRHSRLLGRPATTVDYGRAEYATILAPVGPVFVEVRGRLGARAAYETVLHSLRRVAVDTWLAAMPPGVVGPDNRAETVERMLRDVPYPPSFDLARLEDEPAVLDHYNLGVKVADDVSCGWVESWLAARQAGDSTAEERAVAAMASSHHWPLLREMEREAKHGWALNIWHAAAELKSGRLNQGFDSALVRPDGSGYRLGPAWALELQCTPRIRRVPFTASEGPPGGP
jgi:hypothetical protein